jgi:hypothetical protein
LYLHELPLSENQGWAIFCVSPVLFRILYLHKE